MLKKVGVKSFLIFKSHIFPQVKKPIRSVAEYLALTNPTVDKMKLKKMTQLLDEEEKRKLKIQQNNLNESLNLQLRKYYQKYILPFQSCPDYYEMLFEYAKLKMDHYFSNFNQNYLNKQQQEQEPFYLIRKDINRLAKMLKYQKKQKILLNSDTKYQNSFHHTKKENFKFQQNLLQKQLETQQQPKIYSVEEQKLLYKIFKNLYPSQKLIVYNRFQQLYKDFLLKSEQITKFLLQQTIYQVKPFIYSSPLEIYQAKHYQMNLKQCENQLLKNVQQRDKFNVQFVDLLLQRKRENQYMQEKLQIPSSQIHSHLRRQYRKLNQNQSFYSILKI